MNVAVDILYPWTHNSVALLYFRCHNLVYASFCYCEHVTDAGVELLGTLPSLTSLDLSGCNIQDQGVAALGNNPRFRDITLAECRNITDLGLQVRRNTSTYFPHGGEEHKISRKFVLKHCLFREIRSFSRVNLEEN